MRRAAAARTALGLLTTTHLLAQLRGPSRVAELTQPFLMPAVGAVLATRPPGGARLRRAVAAGLVAACAGDTLPRFQRGDTALRTTMVCFAGTHVAYLVGLAPTARARIRRQPSVLVVPVLGYGALLVVVQRACATQAREAGLTGAVAGYGALLAAMGTVTALAGGRMAVGGALFAASDVMIALGRFVRGWHPRVVGLDLHDALVMLTYVAAQTLVAEGATATSPRAKTRMDDDEGEVDPA